MVVRSCGGGEDDVADACLRRRVDEVPAVAQPLGRAGVRVLEDEDQRAGATQGAHQRGRLVELGRAASGTSQRTSCRRASRSSNSARASAPNARRWWRTAPP